MTKIIIIVSCLFMTTHTLAQEGCDLFSKILFKIQQRKGKSIRERMEENVKKAQISFSFSHKNDAIVSYLQLISNSFHIYNSSWTAEGKTLVEQGRKVFKPRGEEFDQAINLFGRAIKESDDPSLVAQAYKYRGIAYFIKKELAAAREDFNKAIEMGSGEDLSELYFFRGAIKIIFNDSLGAIDDLSKVVPTNDPKFAVAHYFRAPHYFKEGKTDEAINDYIQLLKIHPRDALAHFQLAKFYTLLKQPNQALISYRQALKWGLGKDYGLRLFYGHTLLTQGLVYEALEHLNYAVTLSPKDARGLYLRGIVKKLLDDTEGSEADFKTALLLNPSVAEWTFFTDDQFLDFTTLVY